jgi:hypothetical protein
MSTTIVRLSALGLAVVVVTMAYAVDNAIDAKSQKVTNNEVTVASVTTAEDALVVIHPQKTGEKNTPDTSVVLGYVAVKAGKSAEVKVVLQKTVSPGTRLLATLYTDAGEKGRFEPGTDKPVVGANGKPVVNPFKVQ